MPVRGSSLMSDVIRFAAIKNMLANSCISLHQMFIAHLYVSGITCRMDSNG